MRLPKRAKISDKVPSEKKQGTSSDNTSISLIIPLSKIELWLAIVPEPSQRSHPLLVIYEFGASVSDYACHPIVSGVLYYTVWRLYFAGLNFRELLFENISFKKFREFAVIRHAHRMGVV